MYWFELWLFDFFLTKEWTGKTFLHFLMIFILRWVFEVHWSTIKRRSILCLPLWSNLMSGEKYSEPHLTKRRSTASDTMNGKYPTWIFDLGKNQHSAWENPIDIEKRKGGRHRTQRAQTIVVIKERTREETSSMNIHVGYFPFMVSVPWQNCSITGEGNREHKQSLCFHHTRSVWRRYSVARKFAPSPVLLILAFHRLFFLSRREKNQRESEYVSFILVFHFWSRRQLGDSVVQDIHHSHATRSPLCEKEESVAGWPSRRS